jgi:hypothetical protein
MRRFALAVTSLTLLSVSLQASEAPVPTISEDLLRQRDQLREQFHKSFVDLKDIADIEETGNGITVNVYINRFFMPNSAILDSDGFSALNQLVALLRKRPGKQVRLNSVFKVIEGSKQFENDLAGFHSPRGSEAHAQFIHMEESIPEALAIQRTIIIFSYVLSGALQKQNVITPAKS